MRILLTGSSSFTGTWFARSLALAGHEVTVTMTGAAPDTYEDPLRARRVADVLEHTSEARFGLVFGDGNFVDLAGRQFDVLCHHGADVTNYKSPDFDVQRALASNTRQLRQTLDAFRAGGGRSVVLTGSVFEGGEGAGSEGLPHFSPYGLSKALTAEIFRYECARAELPLGKFVIPNPFGPLEDPRFTAYLMRTWFAGGTPAVRTPDYVRDNIHVSLLAGEYVRFVAQLGELGGPSPGAFTRLSPSGYVESQGQFATRFASELGPRLGLECPLELAEQAEFDEPRVRIGLDPVHTSRASEQRAWDALAEGLPAAPEAAAIRGNDPVNEQAPPWVCPTRLAVVIVSYRAVDLTIDCLESLESEIASVPGVGVIVCENGTGGDAAETLHRVVRERQWQQWVEIREVHPNRGFSGGNNFVLDDILKWESPPESVLLLNADTIVRPGAIAALLAAADANPEAGVISPRLEWPDGTPQISCFRHFRPLTELDKSAGLGVITRLLRRYVTAIDVVDVPTTPDWTSFACALIRLEVLRRVGVLDPGFFLYFDDPDYCRRVWEAGYTVRNEPAAHVVHLRGGSNPAKELKREGKRRPWYHFASRARFYAKHHGRVGLLLANLCWTLGHTIARVRQLLGGKPAPVCEREARDVWAHFWRPMAMPDRGQDG